MADLDEFDMIVIKIAIGLSIILILLIIVSGIATLATLNENANQCEEIQNGIIDMDVYSDIAAEYTIDFCKDGQFKHKEVTKDVYNYYAKNVYEGEEPQVI